MSGNVVWHITMSVDGYIAGPEDSMDWGAGPTESMPEIAEEVLAGAGAILGGRRWYEVAAEKFNGREGIYGGRWRGPIFVLTHKPPEEPRTSISYPTGSRTPSALLSRERTAATW